MSVTVLDQPLNGFGESYSLIEPASAFYTARLHSAISGIKLVESLYKDDDEKHEFGVAFQFATGALLGIEYQHDRKIGSFEGLVISDKIPGPGKVITLV